MTRIWNGAINAGRMGSVDQLKRDTDVTVVVIADLGDHKTRLSLADFPIADLQTVGGPQGNGNDPPMAVEKRQGDDPGRENGCQFCC